MLNFVRSTTAGPDGRDGPTTKREAKKSRGPYTYHICIKRREFAEKASAEGAINAGTTDGFYIIFLYNISISRN